MIAIGVVVRPAGFQDLEALHALALTAGLGMTNLLPCRERLSALLAASEVSGPAPDWIWRQVAGGKWASARRS